MTRGSLSTRGARLALGLSAALGLVAGVATEAHAAPWEQTEARIVVVGYPDLVGDGPAAPECVGCDLNFTNGDSLASSSNPLPLLEFVLKDASGQEVERRMTSALSDGRRPTSFVVAAADDFTVELAQVPVDWEICSNDTTTKSVSAADFGADNRVQLDFFFWHGCEVSETATPGPTSSVATATPGGPTSTPRPTRTPRPTSTRPIIPTAGPSPTPSSREDGDEGDDEDMSAAEAAMEQPGIRGLVYIDVDSDGDLAPDEPGLGPVVVQLSGEGLDLETTTPPAGTFNFADLEAGEYVVTVVPPAGYDLTTTDHYDVTVEDEVVMGIDFGLFPEDGLSSLPVPPRAGTAPRLPSTGAQPGSNSNLILILAALAGLLAALGLAIERRSDRGIS